MNTTYKILFVICCLFAQCVHAQEKIKIKGVVTDTLMVPISNVNVLVKNKPGFGVTTNDKGEYSIDAVKNDLLSYSYIGFKTLDTLFDGANTTINIQLLVSKDRDIDEVVVVGFGTQKKLSLVGAVTTITPEQLKTPTSSITNALGGQVAGIITAQRTGEPGASNSNFWIRGINTFGANQNALVLVDGIDRGSINDISPDDIESFTILKDASATAVYGVRGANGVILITTKKGVAGKPKFNTRFEHGILTPSRLQKFEKAYDYALLANEARAVRDLTPLYSKEEIDIIQYGLDPDIYPDINWRDYVMRKSTNNTNFTINTSGGGETARYYISTGYYNESGLYKFSDLNKYNTNVNLKRYSFRSNVDVNITKSTLAQVGVGGFISDINYPGVGSADIWGSLANLTPLTVPLRYSTGQMASYGSGNSANPYVLLTQTGFIKNWTNKIESNLRINQDLSSLLKGLRAHVLYSFDANNYHNINRTKFPELYRASRERDRNGDLQLRKVTEQTPLTFSKSSYGNRRNYLEGAINYMNVFGDHTVSGLLLYNQSDLMTSEANDEIASIPYRMQGIAGRTTYGYRSKYLLELNFGYNGSENFEKKSQYGFFPSVGAGWVISEENFIKKHLPFIDILKVRGSYGEVGNDQIGGGKRFPYITFVNLKPENLDWSFGDYGNNTFSGLTEGALGADNLSWEIAKKTNLGFDIELFKSKFTTQIDLFKERRSGIFMQRNTLPDIVGVVTAPWGNVGIMDNKGIDASATYRQQMGNVFFAIRGNFTYNKSKIIEFDEPEPRFPYQGSKGLRYGQQKGLISLGLFRDSLDVISSPTQFGEVRPGDIKYKDINADGKIDDDDIVPVGQSSVPGIIYGFGSEIQWKSFSFAFRFQGAGDVSFFLGGTGMYPFAAGETGNVLSIVGDPENRWTPAWYSGDPATENPNARFPRLDYGNNSNNNRNSTFWLADAKYLRLKEVQVGYTFPKQISQKLKMNHFRIYATGFNLWVWDSIKLWDPEQASANGSAYPIQRTVNLGLEMRF
jgi:TonB-linked SusC/RagA family outer membrane protein